MFNYFIDLNNKESINSVNNVTDNFTEKEIDFSVYQVIAIFDEVKGNGGWTIDITGITELQDKIVVAITNLKKGGLTAVMTQPFQIVKIPVSEKEIIFQLSGQLAGNWKVKSQNLAGKMANTISHPDNALYSDISIQIPNTLKGHITGNTFYNSIWVDFEIKDNQQINFKKLWWNQNCRR